MGGGALPACAPRFRPYDSGIMRAKLIVLLRALARPTLLFYALPWLMCLLALGTVAQRYIGLYQSQNLFFGSFLLWVGPVPLPGAYSLLALIALSLLANLALSLPFTRAQAGIILTHVSVVILLVGGLMTALDRQEGYMVLGEGESAHTVFDYQQPDFVGGQDRYSLKPSATRELPFTIRLKHFDKSDYPGTSMARSYDSDVVVKDGGLEWNASITMNHPLRLHGYTLYQSSFIDKDGRLLTVLAVVKNVGWLLPYLAIATLCVGLLLHLVILSARRRA